MFRRFQWRTKSIAQCVFSIMVYLFLKDSKWKSIKIFSNHKVSRLHQSEYKDHLGLVWLRCRSFRLFQSQYDCVFLNLNSSLFRMTSQRPMKQLLIRDQTHSNEYRTILADTNPMWAWQYNLNVVMYLHCKQFHLFPCHNFICIHMTSAHTIEMTLDTFKYRLKSGIWYLYNH